MLKWPYLSLLICFALIGCNSESHSQQGLVADLIKHTRSDDPTDAFLSFSLLSDIALEDAELARLVNDYQLETDSLKKYYYEYVLAKRTQELTYINAFIHSSQQQMALLLTNSTRRISIEHPFISLLTTYSTTDNQALKVLLQLARRADGAHLSVICSNLKMLYDANADRVVSTAASINMNKDLLATYLIEE